MPATSVPPLQQTLQQFLLRALALPATELPAQAVAALAQAQCLDLAKGAPLLQAGQPWADLWWLQSGALRLYYLDRTGNASNKNFYLQGALLWPITRTLAEQPASFFVEAVAPSQVWRLPFASWAEAMADVAPWARFERRVLTLLLDDKMRREQQFLQLSASQRYLDLLARHPDWLQQLPLRHLASYLGITDVALSRLRRQLKSPESGPPQL